MLFWYTNNTKTLDSFCTYTFFFWKLYKVQGNYIAVNTYVKFLNTILKAYSQHLIYTLIAKCMDINKHCTVHTGTAVVNKSRFILGLVSKDWSIFIFCFDKIKILINIYLWKILNFTLYDLWDQTYKSQNVSFLCYHSYKFL